MSARNWLQPRALARIRDLRLLARLVAEGTLHGLHRGRQMGSGMEFNQYRAYEPGDEPRQIDWRLYARSDKMFVRQSERESHVTVWLLVDASASMAQPSDDIPDWTRLDCARAIAASLAWLCQQQGDRFGLISLSDDGPRCVPLGLEEQHLDRLLISLQQLRAKGQWPSQSQFDGLWPSLQAPGLVVVMSDFFQREDEIESMIAKLQAGGNDVLTLQLLSRNEQDFSFSGNVEFVDRETGLTVRTDAKAARSDYLNAFNRAQNALDQQLAALGVNHFRATLEAPLDTVVWQFLKARERITFAARSRRR